MDIYKITAISSCVSYDSFDSHIVIADTEEQVLQLAKEKAADEGEEAWVKDNIKKYGKCSIEYAQPLILLSSFNAG